jgi:sugar phosphate isomerase/epimerase
MSPKLKLGFDNYAIRALGWKAPQLLDYAGSLQLDAILLSDLDVYEDPGEAYFLDLKKRADDLGLEIQVGTLSICPSSVMFDPRRGTAEEQIKRAIRVARALGSPIARCVLGEVRDRRGTGGIEARIAETLGVLRQVRSYAIDCGIKIAIENHAGDMQSWELVALIEEAGIEFVGATMDSGNATWALEHPLESLEILGPYAVATGIRDSALWPVEDGAVLQWTALGEGSVDWNIYFARFAELCPETPVQIETISGRPIAIPFWNDGFWDAYRNARIPEFMKFMALVRAGAPQQPVPAETSEGPGASAQEFQKAELEKSIRFCREVLGLGRKS